MANVFTALSKAAVLFLVSSGVAYAGGALLSDYREALERGCTHEAAGNRAAYHSCMQNTLAQLERGRKLTEIDSLPSGTREQIRLSCVGKKDVGLFEYDDCVKSQVQKRTNSADREDRRPAVIEKGSGDRNESMNPAKLFELTSSSVYFVIARNDSRSASIGSAVALSAALLLTNCHVIGQAQTVMMSGGEATPWAASLRYADRKADRCVIESSKRVTPVPGVRPYGDLKIGERVYTIGNPSGLIRTLAEGLISGLRERDGVKLVQTSAAISPGSSGGGLFDNRGRLIGITTFLVGDHSSLGFAIAADEFVSLPVFAR